MNNLNVFLKTHCRKGLGGIQPSEQDGTKLKHSKWRSHPEIVCQFSSTRTSRPPTTKKNISIMWKTIIYFSHIKIWVCLSIGESLEARSGLAF